MCVMYNAKKNALMMKHELNVLGELMHFVDM